MKCNMKTWVQEMLNAPKKKPMPILSFPAIQLMDISVKDLIQSSDLQAKGMKLVADRVDSAISVSLMDLSLEAECFGSTIRVSDDEVPTVIGSIVDEPEDAEALVIPSLESGRVPIYIEAVKKAVEMIDNKPVLAGAIGPFSLAGRLMDVTEAMVYCYDEPEMVHTVLEKVTTFIIDYCKAYKAVGANGVVIAEPLAGLLSPDLAAEFSAPYMKKLVDAVQDDEFIVVYHNCGNCTLQQVDSILSIGAPILHFGNAIDMEEMLKLVPSDVIVAGNVDPAGVIRNGSPESIKEVTTELMEKCCKYPNYVISTGCDIPPLSSWENIDSFFAAVEDYYNK